MTGTPDLNELRTEWRTARLLYPLYAALARLEERRITAG